MSLTKYRAFLLVASTGSFSEAAEQLHCTQSAVSRMILDLENIWGVKLFSRFKTGAELTAEGEQLLPYVQNIVTSEDDFKSVLSSLTGSVVGTVRIASFASVATVWLPRVIGEFKKKYPQISYEIVMGDYGEIEYWVKSGRVDFGFTSPVITEDLYSVLVLRDKLLLGVSEKHPYYSMDRVPAQLLEGEPFFLLEKGRPGSVAHYLNSVGVKPDIQLKTFQDYTILNMVKMNLGLGMVPQLVLQFPVDTVAMKELDPPAYREILLVLRKGRSLSLVAKKFLVCLAQELEKELDPTFVQKIKNMNVE